MVPDPKPDIPPGTPSGDQLLGNSKDKPVPPQLDVNNPEPDTSASNPLPIPVEQTGFPPQIPLDGSTATTPGLGLAAPLGLNLGVGLPCIPAGDQPVTPLTQTTTHTGGNPHTESFAGIMEGLKEVCGMMTTGFQRACLDVEEIVQKTLQEAT